MAHQPRPDSRSVVTHPPLPEGGRTTGSAGGIWRSWPQALALLDEFTVAEKVAEGRIASDTRTSTRTYG